MTRLGFLSGASACSNACNNKMFFAQLCEVGEALPHARGQCHSIEPFGLVSFGFGRFPQTYIDVGSQKSKIACQRQVQNASLHEFKRRQAIEVTPDISAQTSQIHQTVPTQSRCTKSISKRKFLLLLWK